MPDEITTEVLNEPVEITESANTPEVNEPETQTEVDLSSILDSVLKELESEEPKTQETEKNFGPKIETQVHESEAKVMLEKLKEELDKTQKANTEEKEKTNNLLQELEDLKAKQELATKEVETYKGDFELLNEFFVKLSETPVLGDLVKLAAEKGTEAINIPKYLKELQESRIMAQGVTPEAEVPAKKEEKQVSGLEAALLKRNKR